MTDGQHRWASDRARPGTLAIANHRFRDELLDRTDEPADMLVEQNPLPRYAHGLSMQPLKEQVRRPLGHGAAGLAAIDETAMRQLSEEAGS